jgi:hypothetical protein
MVIPAELAIKMSEASFDLETMILPLCSQLGLGGVAW